MRTVEYAMSTEDTNQKPSSALWAGVPILEALLGQNGDYFYRQDFRGPVATATGYGFTATQATAGTFAKTDLLGGGALLDAGSSTQGEGINVQETGEVWKPSTGKKIVFEARVKFSATDHQFFVGLHTQQTDIIASNAKKTGAGYSCIGWSRDDGTGTKDMEFTCLNGATGSSVDVDGLTTIDSDGLAADTWIKLGFVCENINGTYTVTPFVNGVGGTAVTDADAIAATEMAVSLVCQTNGSVQPTMTVDWYQVYMQG